MTEQIRTAETIEIVIYTDGTASVSRYNRLDNGELIYRGRYFLDATELAAWRVPAPLREVKCQYVRHYNATGGDPLEYWECIRDKDHRDDHWLVRHGDS